MVNPTQDHDSRLLYNTNHAFYNTWKKYFWLAETAKKFSSLIDKNKIKTSFHLLLHINGVHGFSSTHKSAKTSVAFVY